MFASPHDVTFANVNHGCLYFVFPARLFTWILSTVIGGKDNRPPDLPRDDYYDSSLLELQPTEAETKGATKISGDGGVDYCGIIDEVKFASPTLQLQEEGPTAQNR